MGTFYQRPNTQADENNFENTNIPQMVRPNSFARWSSIFGTIALIGVFTFTVYPPIIFGSLAIILAFLSISMYSISKKGKLVNTQFPLILHNGIIFKITFPSGMISFSMAFHFSLFQAILSTL